MQKPFRRIPSSLALLAAVLTVAGCHKKASPPPPPPPLSNTGTTPTADLSVSPTSIAPGGSASLVWHTSGATDVSIEGLGQVATSGTQTVKPTESTTYHLVARGDGGSTDATARITVGGDVTPQPSSNLSGTDMDDALFHQNVQDVFFDYDSYDVNSTSQATITKDAAFLNQHSGVRIVLGGYCDERGSTEYNLALGENRANAAKQALVSAGVDAGRIRTVSYGKEKQFCSEHDESCFQQNRRAQFAVDR